MKEKFVEDFLVGLATALLGLGAAFCTLVIIGGLLKVICLGYHLLF